MNSANGTKLRKASQLVELQQGNDFVGTSSQEITILNAFYLSLWTFENKIWKNGRCEKQNTIIGHCGYSLTNFIYILYHNTQEFKIIFSSNNTLKIVHIAFTDKAYMKQANCHKILTKGRI